MKKTDAEKQKTYRLRLKADGKKEVRGIYVNHKHHARIKRYAAKVEAEAKIENKPEDW